MIVKQRIIRIDNTKKYCYDNMVKEKEYNLIVNGNHINSYICLDKCIKELVVGSLNDLNLINNIEQVKKITITNNNIDVDIETANIAIKKIKKDKVDLSLISKIMEDFNTGSLLFQETGAIHTYGIYDNASRIIIKEDVGRHNALDKMIGYSIINNIDLSNKIIVTSGRLTLEIARKISKHPIKAIISISTPTINAIKIFEKENITAIGFARNNRFNVYTNVNKY